ncbi:unnamed protein product, partial [Allacma fusca]
DLKEENGSLGGPVGLEGGTKSLGIGTNGTGSILEDGGLQIVNQHTSAHLPISHHCVNNVSLQRETSPSSTSTMDGHSPSGGESGSCLSDIVLSEHPGRTPERCVNGTFTNATTINSRAAFPMEASTQTQTIHTDNPQGFVDHSAEEGLTHFA